MGRSDTAKEKVYIWDIIKRTCNVCCGKNNLVIGGKKKSLFQRKTMAYYSFRVLTSKQVKKYMHIVTFLCYCHEILKRPLVYLSPKTATEEEKETENKSMFHL